MTRLQVRDVLGSPLLTDPFHANRWDYIFTLARPGSEPQRRSVVADLRRRPLVTIEAPELPTEREFVASVAAPAAGDAMRLALSEEQIKALPVPAKTASRRRRWHRRATDATVSAAGTVVSDAARARADVLKIAVAGASGRMGQMLVEAVHAAPTSA